MRRRPRPRKNATRRWSGLAPSSPRGRLSWRGSNEPILLRFVPPPRLPQSAPVMGRSVPASERDVEAGESCAAKGATKSVVVARLMLQLAPRHAPFCTHANSHHRSGATGARQAVWQGSWPVQSKAGGIPDPSRADFHQQKTLTTFRRACRDAQ